MLLNMLRLDGWKRGEVQDHEFPLEVKEIEIKDVVSKKHYLMCLLEAERLEVLDGWVQTKVNM